ncbi:hypothetical protein Daus18300_014222 [Diaporthe australafricana]|uniref:Amidohydrolase n=1 Tax=Diaporthe australafricana TaxID=127596 RepID=A0ABR3VW22_9PEZI
MDNSDIVSRYRPDLNQFEAIYRSIHENAELSGKESETAQRVADHLSSLGFFVAKGVGGTGVIGVLRNGQGQCIMLRAELDALPIREATGLPYACSKTMKDSWGLDQPVMHACGHDLHLASLLATATLMKEAESQWQGTLVLVFQPNEEHTGGAQAMVDEGLYDIVPVPDAIFGQHSGPFQAGHVRIRSGPVLVSADSVKIRLYSSLGHAANPQVNIDPVKVASALILRSDEMAREASGGEFASITVNEIHAGHPGQDWVSHVDLVLDVKTYSEDIRQKLLRGIRDMATKLSHEAGVPKPPTVTTSVRAPLTRNDEGLTEILRQSFIDHFGPEKVGDALPKHPCEDFSRLAAPFGTPYVFWFFGRQDPVEFEEAVRADEFLDKVPINHSPFNGPVLRPTLQTGTDALALAALNFLSRNGTQISERPRLDCENE